MLDPMLPRLGEKLTTALLDRLAHHAVVTTRGQSFRMRKRGEPPKTLPQGHEVG